MNKNLFETKIKPVLSYVGAIGAGLMCIAYVIVVFVIIQGFQATIIFNTLLFAAVNAVLGFIILQFGKVQGISFAKLIPENDKIIKECAAVVCVSESYTKSCMMKRNRALVNCCDLLIAVFDGQKGGTANTISYARSKAKEIITVSPK